MRRFVLAVALALPVTAHAEPKLGVTPKTTAGTTPPSTTNAKWTFVSPTGLPAAHFSTRAEAEHFAQIHENLHNVKASVVQVTTESPPPPPNLARFGFAGHLRDGHEPVSGFASPANRLTRTPLGAFLANLDRRNVARVQFETGTPQALSGDGRVVQPVRMHLAVDDFSNRFWGHRDAYARGVVVIQHPDGSRAEQKITMRLLYRPMRGAIPHESTPSYLGEWNFDLEGKRDDPRSLGEIVEVKLGFHGLAGQQSDTNFGSLYTVFKKE